MNDETMKWVDKAGGILNKQYTYQKNSKEAAKKIRKFVRGKLGLEKQRRFL